MVVLAITKRYWNETAIFHRISANPAHNEVIVFYGIGSYLAIRRYLNRPFAKSVHELDNNFFMYLKPFFKLILSHN